MDEAKTEVTETIVVARLELGKKVIERSDPGMEEKFSTWMLTEDRAMLLSAALICEVPDSPVPRTFAYEVAITVEDFLKLDDWKTLLQSRIEVDLLNDVRLILGYLAQSGMKGGVEVLEAAMAAGREEVPTLPAEPEKLSEEELANLVEVVPLASGGDLLGFPRWSADEGEVAYIKTTPGGGIVIMRAGARIHRGSGVMLKHPDPRPPPPPPTPPAQLTAG